MNTDTSEQWAGDRSEYGERWPERPLTTHEQDEQKRKFEAALAVLRPSLRRQCAKALEEAVK